MKKGWSFVLATGMGVGLLTAGGVAGQDGVEVEEVEGVTAEAMPALSEEAQAEAEFEEFLASFEWKRDGVGTLGGEAELEIPEGYRFADGPTSQAVLQAFGNLISEPPAGMVGSDGLEWFAVFQFDEVGYVADDEKDELEPDAMLKQMKAAEEVSNEYREEAGLDKLYTVGWAKEPFYNERTHNLEWGIIIRDDEGNQSVNYKTKLLGRNGVMDVTLVCDPADLETYFPDYETMLEGFRYTSGNTYAEYRDGDKLAEYGLTALVVGGGAALAAKAGLFAPLLKFMGKAWKLVVAGVVAVGFGIKKVFGGKKSPYTA